MWDFNPDPEIKSPQALPTEPARRPREQKIFQLKKQVMQVKEHG